MKTLKDLISKIDTILYLVLFALIFSIKTFAQDWTWMNGSNAFNQAANYGTKTVPAPTNSPGQRRSSVSWTDKQGNLWLFGGSLSSGQKNDLWKYDVITNEWTWMHGGNVINQYGIYGTKGVASVSNTPGARYDALGWVDKTGNLWLYGGLGLSIGPSGALEDLWKYDIATNQWTWINGASGPNNIATYGTKGISSPSNNPAGRGYMKAFTDTSGNFWLFGGIAFVNDYLNDLWKYDVSTNEWTWVSGSNIVAQQGNYGIQGVSNSSNMPGSRGFTTTWSDNQNNFWLYGGIGYAETGIGGLDDLWKYNVSTNEWTWVKGSKVTDQSGNYGVIGTSSVSNSPGNRNTAMSWSNNIANNLYMFGGSAIDYTRLNDMWKYDINTNEWTWIKGSNIGNQNGIYGVQGISDPNNMPGSRQGGACWVDNLNNFWLFGGGGLSETGLGGGILDDMWKFDNPIIPTNIKNSTKDNNIAIYPNPNNGIFNVSWKGARENAELIIINTLGQNVFTQVLNNEISTINVPNIKAGLYTLLIMKSKAIIGTNKMIIE